MGDMSKIGDGVADRQPRDLLDPAILARRVELEEHIAIVRRENQIDGAVSETELSDQLHAAVGDIAR